eukprot:8176842-Pyramimonas_sp.AAC.1
MHGCARAIRVRPTPAYFDFCYPGLRLRPQYSDVSLFRVNRECADARALPAQSYSAAMVKKEPPETPAVTGEDFAQ